MLQSASVRSGPGSETRLCPMTVGRRPGVDDRHSVHCPLGRRGVASDIHTKSNVERRCSDPLRCCFIAAAGVRGSEHLFLLQHGQAKRRTWRKIHLAVDPDTHEIVAEVLTENDDHDAHQVARSLVETAMHRLKCCLGDRLKNRKLPNQQTEARLRCKFLNRFLQLGMPRFAWG